MTQSLKTSPKTSQRPLFLRKRGFLDPKKGGKPPKIPGAVAYRGNLFQKKFTGKEQDPETGLYYYGARYLDPKTSRWLSGDPALGEYLPSAPLGDEEKGRNQNLPGMGGIFNTVNMHAYHYAGNNPVKYVDPDGEALNVAFAIFGAAAGGLFAAVVSIQAGSSVEDTIINAIIGAAGGAMAGFAVTVGGGMAAGAAIGAASNIISQRLTGDGEVDGTQVIIAAAIGLVAGGGGVFMGQSIASSTLLSPVVREALGAFATTATATMAGGLTSAITALMEMNK